VVYTVDGVSVHHVAKLRWESQEKWHPHGTASAAGWLLTTHWAEVVPHTSPEHLNMVMTSNVDAVHISLPTKLLYNNVFQRKNDAQR
jgi:hypothetical protein